MLFSTTLMSALGLLASQVAGQGYQCPLMMPDEVTALEFAHGVQNWLYQYYSTKGGTTADQFADFPNATMVQSNGETLAMNIANNFAGLEQQAKLGVEALEQLATGKDLSSSCDFTWPAGIDTSAMDFFTASYFIEATLCGTFIGLGDYVQSPTAAFLMARLAAEHGIHASYLGSYVNPVPYSSDSMSLTPAFTPEFVLTPGSGQAVRANVGHLGAYIPQGCLAVPEAPCGVNVHIGNLTATLSKMANATATASMPSYSGPVATGAATIKSVSSLSLIGGLVVGIRNLL